MPMEKRDRDENRPPPRLLAERYQSYDKSGLQVTVRRETNQLTITVDRP